MDLNTNRFLFCFLKLQNIHPAVWLGTIDESVGSASQLEKGLPNWHSYRFIWWVQLVSFSLISHFQNVCKCSAQKDLYWSEEKKVFIAYRCCPNQSNMATSFGAINDNNFPLFPIFCHPCTYKMEKEHISLLPFEVFRRLSFQKPLWTAKIYFPSLVISSV